MRLKLQGRNIELTPALKQYATEKLTRITKLFDQIIEISATLSVERNPSIHDNQVAEVMVVLNKGRIQAKESSDNMYASIDLLTDKVERQIRKYKTKLVNRAHTKSGSSTIREAAIDQPVEQEERIEEDLDVNIDIVEEDVVESEVLNR